ncbi:MAG: LCP family protein [Acetatifactor sp.]
MSTSGANSKKKMTAKERAAKKRRKIIIFAVEISVILLMVIALYMVTRTTAKSEGPKYVTLEPEKLEIPVEVQENETMKGYMNIALFGVDAMNDDELYKGSRSDSIMIASINMDTGDIKLVSVYRDTYLNLGNDSYRKCNAAYSYGGAEQAVKMLNMNLDMDIENFVTVGYKGLREVIDGLGGVYIDVDETELKHINNYQISIVEKVLKCDYTPVTETGYQLLDGLQAAAYCRIRYGGGDDFKRAGRQREVLKAIEEQAKKADLATLTKVFNSAIDDIYTSLDSKDILDLLANISNYRIVDENGFPQENMRYTCNIGAKGSSVVPTDLVSNVVWLHQFLFEDETYTVTDAVREYSAKIVEETQQYIDKDKSKYE